jgi:hypothetical protein
MWFSYLSTLRRAGSQSTRPVRKRSCRLLLEVLEDRALPSFLTPGIYPVGGGDPTVAVGDFTGTGIPDLVVANSGAVSVFLGKGDGTFRPAQNYAVGGAPVSVAVGDFNNDGKLDIVTANYDSPSSSTVSVLLGNGDGTFQPALNSALPAGQQITSGYASQLAVGDFNKDGKLDVAVVGNVFTYTGYYSGTISPYVNVLIGNGAGGFSADNSYALTGGFADGVAVGDFTGKGNLDLAVAKDSGVDVLLGNGDGTFAAPTTFATGSWPFAVAVGDLNGNGKLDIVTAASNGIDVLMGNGNGTFGPAVNYPTGYQSNSIALADFNRDGKLDVVTTNNVQPGTVSVFLGFGDGTFAPAQDFATGLDAWPMAVAAGDFNSDGWPDLAVSNGGSLSVLVNDGTWPAPGTEATSLGVSGFPSPTAAGTPASFTVTAKQADGATATSYMGTVYFTSSDPQAVLPAKYTFTAADAGVHTFSATLKTAGAQSITATDILTPSLTGSETGITVNPAAARTLSVAGFPSPITAGVAGTFTVAVRDLYGNIATGYNGTIHFTSSDSKASLPSNYTFTAGDAGVHTFTASLKTAGTQSITATDTTTASITGTDAGLVVNPAAASQFIVSAPASITAGTSFSLTLTVEDAYGNVVTNYAGTVQFSTTDKKATLPKKYTFTTSDKGVHTFTGLVLQTTGNQKITITDTQNSLLTASVIVDVL